MTITLNAVDHRKSHASDPIPMSMNRLFRALLLVLCVASSAHAAPPQKVLRYAFEVAETSLDPVKSNDLYSHYITGHLFEGLFEYDPLARPVKPRPLVAAAMPVGEDDFKSWTIKIKPGIYFADDPAFKGVKRELVAEDFIYVLKRIADPANRSFAWSEIEQIGYLGLPELREQALKNKQFDYDRPIPGARAIDRYTLQFKLKDPRPRFIDKWVNSSVYGAQAREVVEFYGDRIAEHPVGTGPFKLVQWRRASFIACERNPTYRERFYESDPAPDDAEAQEIAARLRGRRLPMVDRVEVSVIDEQQPRWLAFLNGQADVIQRMGPDFTAKALPNGQLAPNLRKLNLKAFRIIEPSTAYTFFNMDDPTVGGYTPEKVALRRAISLGMDSERTIRLVYRDGVVAQSPIAPGTTGYDPAFRSEMGAYDPARAKALLDLYGYVDRNGDGWREMPDGSPLVLRLTTLPDQQSRAREELMNKEMTAIGIRLALETMPFADALKRGRAGSLAAFSLSGTATEPDGVDGLERYFSGQIGGQNFARFRLPAYDALLARLRTMPDGPERLALIDEAKRLAVAWMPYKMRFHRISYDMAQPWVIGYRKPLFAVEWWHNVDVERP